MAPARPEKRLNLLRAVPVHGPEGAGRETEMPLSQTCPECGGPMVIAKHSERLGDTPPDPGLDAPEPLVEDDARAPDFAAEDVEHLEEITAKRATLACARCGATLAVPDL